MPTCSRIAYACRSALEYTYGARACAMPAFYSGMYQNEGQTLQRGPFEGSYWTAERMKKTAARSRLVQYQYTSRGPPSEFEAFVRLNAGLSHFRTPKRSMLSEDLPAGWLATCCSHLSRASFTDTKEVAHGNLRGLRQ